MGGRPRPAQLPEDRQSPVNPYLDTPRIEGGRRLVQKVDKADALRDGCNLHWRERRELRKRLTSRRALVVGDGDGSGETARSLSPLAVRLAHNVRQRPLGLVCPVRAFVFLVPIREGGSRKVSVS